MRRIYRWLIGIGIVVGAIGGLHLYVGRRMITDVGLAGLPALAGWLLLAGMFLLLLYHAFGQRLRWPGVRLLVWPTSLWLGSGFVLIVVLAISDLLLWGLGSPAWAGSLQPAPASGLGALQAGAAGVATLVLTGVGLRSALRVPSVRRVEVQLARGAVGLEGMRIAQISDLHIGPILRAEFLRGVVARVNALEPDLVAVTGDLVDGSVERFAREIEPLSALRARHGSYFVTGNHDHYSGADPWVARVEALGLRVLRNARVTLEHAGAGLEVAGVDDYRGGYTGSTEDLVTALEGRDPSLPVLLLAHEPATFVEAAASGVDLQISGHTHGGQIWPFRYLVRLSTPWVAGLYRRGSSQLYVSRGTGFWGPPMRIGAPAEITLIELRAPAGS